MRPITSILCVNAALLIAGVSLLIWQRQAFCALRAEFETLQFPADEIARLTAENRRLASSQVSADELKNLRSDHAALARLRADLAGLKDRAEDRIRKPSLEPPLPKGAGPVILSSEWQNSGRASPAAMFQTALWAAANGKIDLLAAMLSVEAPGYDQLQTALAALPEGQRAADPTPEQFVAQALAKEFSLSSMQVMNQDKNDAGDGSNLDVRLESAAGQSKNVTFWTFKGDDGWRLVVPNMAVQKYLGTLTAAAPAK